MHRHNQPFIKPFSQNIKWNWTEWNVRGGTVEPALTGAAVRKREMKTALYQPRSPHCIQHDLLCGQCDAVLLKIFTHTNPTKLEVNQSVRHSVDQALTHSMKKSGRTRWYRRCYSSWGYCNNIRNDRTGVKRVKELTKHSEQCIAVPFTQFIHAKPTKHVFKQSIN